MQRSARTRAIDALDLTAVLRRARRRRRARPRDDIPGENNYGAGDRTTIRSSPTASSSTPASRSSPSRRTSYDARAPGARCARVSSTRTLPAILDIRAALAAGSFVVADRDDWCAAIRAARSRAAPHRLQRQHRDRRPGSLLSRRPDRVSRCRRKTARCWSTARRSIRPRCSTSSRTRSACPAHDVIVHCRRMGGGFGGKESQPALFACVARRCSRTRPGGR